MLTALGPAAARCINLQLQKPSSHIKLKDLFWGIERFIAKKKKKKKLKICRIGIWRTLLYASLNPLPVLFSVFLQGDTRNPGEKSKMGVGGCLPASPTLGLGLFPVSLGVAHDSYPNYVEAQAHTKQRNLLLLLWCPVYLGLQKGLFVFRAYIRTQQKFSVLIFMHLCGFCW